MTVYSSLFALSQVHTALATLFTVPGSSTYVVRDIEVVNLSSTGAQVFFAVQAPGFGQLYVIESAIVAAQVSWQWEGRLVIPGTGTLAAQSSVGDFNVAVSGYNLT